MFYEKNHREGFLRNFAGKLYDGDRYVGDRLRGGIYIAADQAWIKRADDKIFVGDARYTFADDTLSTEEVVWYGVSDPWDAMRIVLLEYLGK